MLKVAVCPVLQAKAIHKTAVTDELENISWMHAPMGKMVDIDVPVRVSHA